LKSMLMSLGLGKARVRKRVPSVGAPGFEPQETK
jgi:hypothetical protein